jgi:alpha-1,2-glucosyltransferase
MDIVIIIGYTLAVILTLVPTPLLEFRYFIIPFYFYRILTFKKGDSTQGKIVLNIIVNAVIFWIFLFKPFKAASGEEIILQRFMW